MQIPICDPKQEYLGLQDEIHAAIHEVLASGHYILGPQVSGLEQEVAGFLGSPHAIGVNSGTDALHLALRALDIGPGDEVITTPFTFIATTEAIGMVGATPVFADIDPRTFNLDPNGVEDAVTARTKAILPVHLFGQPCDMAAIMDIAQRHSLRVVEDCAQAIGAAYRGRKVGTWGDVGCFSFFPSKNLGCVGDGGMVVTCHASTYERLEMLRRHGGRIKYHHEELGINSRLDELQAAILRVKFQHLPAWNQARRTAAYRYNELLAEASLVTCPGERRGPEVITPSSEATCSDQLEAVYHQYTILVDQRDQIQKALKASKIESAVYYPIPLHRQAVHQNLGFGPGAFPVAERAATRCLSLPMSPYMTATQQRMVAHELRQSSTRFADLLSEVA